MQNSRFTYLGLTAALAFGVGALVGKTQPSNDSADQSDQASPKRPTTRFQARGERSSRDNARNPSRSAGGGSEMPEDLTELAFNNFDLTEEQFAEVAKQLDSADMDKKAVAEYSLYLTWVQLDPRAAMESSIARYNDNTSLNSLLFDQWADIDPLAAAEKFRENPYVLHVGRDPSFGGNSANVAKSLAKKLNALDPQAAEDWAFTLPTKIKNAALQELGLTDN